jgi:hypothetical protein
MVKILRIILIGFLSSGVVFAAPLLEPSRVTPVSTLPPPSVSILGMAVICLVVYCFLAWWWETREPRAGDIVATPKPPTGLSPSAMRYISLMKFDSKAFMAAVSNMIAKNFISVDKVHRSYVIKKLSDDTSQLSIGEKGLSKELFMDDNAVVIDPDNAIDLDSARNTLYHCLVSEFQNISFAKHTNYLIPAIAIMFLGFIAVLPRTTVSIFVASMITFLVAYSAILFQVLLRPSQKLARNIPDWSLSKLHKEERVFFRLAIFVCVAVLEIALVIMYFDWGISVLLLLMIAMVVVFAHVIKTHTLQGRRVLDKIEGFKLFLKTTTQAQCKALLPDEHQDGLFKKYFPYALALDVADEWADKFGGEEDFLEFYDNFASKICLIIEFDDEELMK